jgi:putative peptidoglycan lipid II flippase
MSLVRAIATLSGLTLVSRVMGFARDLLMASVLGAGVVSDAFLVAFRLPNLFRRLLAEGAFSAAFVPLYTRELTASKEQAKHFATQSFVFLFLTVTALCAVCMVFTPQVVHLLAPGFADEPQKFALTVELCRITLPYMILIVLAAMLTGILNANLKFAEGAASSIWLNLALIAGLSTWQHYSSSAGHAVAWNVTLGGVLQLGILVWALYRYNLQFPIFVRPRLSPEIKRLLKLLLPGILGASVYQLNVMVDTMLATLLPEGAVTYLYYADRLNQLPLGVIGIALGTALLPMLSRQLRENNLPEALKTQNQALEIGLLVAIPTTVVLMLLAKPIMHVLFLRGEFTLEAVKGTSQALQAFAVGLPAYIIIKVLTAGFFARENTKTPVKIAMVCVAANIVLNLILMQWLAHVGLALSTAIAAWLNVFLLSTRLHRHKAISFDKPLVIFLVKCLGAAGIMSAVILYIMPFVTPFLYNLGHHEALRTGVLVAIITGFCVLFALFCALFKAVDGRKIRTAFRRR